MIYIYTGSDTKNKILKIKKLSEKRNLIFLKDNEITHNILLEYASTSSLFGESFSIVVNNLIKDNKISFDKNLFENLANSETIFFFLEEKINSLDNKKYEKFSKIENFEELIIKKKENNISFDIANSFALKDKMKTWFLFNQAMESNISPEAISGVLFWKIKSLLNEKKSIFSKEELKNCSSSLVSIYHKAHLGELDFNISLEKFLLNVLSK